MRILWIGHNLAYPPKGGPLQRNYNLLREAAKKCEVHVLAFDQPATRPDNLTPQECVHALRSFCASVDWVPLAQGKKRYSLALRGLPSSDPFEFHWLKSHLMRDKLETVLQRPHFDVVHFDTLGLAQFRHLVRNSGTVLNHHDVQSSLIARRATLESHFLRRQYWNLEAKKLRRAEKKWCPRFDVNLAVSREDEQILIDSTSQIRSSVVPNGVDTDYFTPRPDPGGRTLLFCGSLDMYPSVDAMSYFFNAIWPTLISRQPNIELFLVGRKPPTWLTQLSAKDHRIHVPGFVDDVRPYFRKATALVCPIRDGGGTRLKILDSLAMGVPVIGTSFASSGLYLEHQKHLLSADTPDDFVRSVEQVLSDKALRERLSNAALEVVNRHYSWGVIGRSLIEAYDAAKRARNNAMHHCN
jgi:polysaccharide biosynthesis protein PslH